MVAYQACARVSVVPYVRMAIGEIEPKTVVMAMSGNGRKIDPFTGGWIGDKKTVVDASLVFVK